MDGTYEMPPSPFPTSPSLPLKILSTKIQFRSLKNNEEIYWCRWYSLQLRGNSMKGRWIRGACGTAARQTRTLPPSLLLCIADGVDERGSELGIDSIHLEDLNSTPRPSASKSSSRNRLTLSMFFPITLLIHCLDPYQPSQNTLSELYGLKKDSWGWWHSWGHTVQLTARDLGVHPRCIGSWTYMVGEELEGIMVLMYWERKTREIIVKQIS